MALLPPVQPSALNDAKGQTTPHGYRWLESIYAAAKAASEAFATAAQYLSNAAGNLGLTPNSVWSAAEFVALTDAATITVDMATGFNFSVSIGGNRTLGNPSNPKVGQSGCFAVTASGSTRTINKGSNYKKTSVAFPISIASGQTCYIYYHVISSTHINITAEMNNPA